MSSIKRVEFEADVQAVLNQILPKLEEETTYCLLDTTSMAFSGSSVACMPEAYHQFDWILGLGVRQKVLLRDAEDWDKELQECLNEALLPLMGYLTYDLQKRTLPVHYPNHYAQSLSRLGFFFEPQAIISAADGKLCLKGAHPEYYKAFVLDGAVDVDGEQTCASGYNVDLNPCLDKEAYLADVEALREEILDGNVYEVNYCFPFEATQPGLNPLQLFRRMRLRSPNPFSALLRNESEFVVSASMERFLRQEGTQLISQPIKGTAKRSKHAMEDDRLKKQLAGDPKERAENIMIVDLVRNDLSRCCTTGSIEVPELCQVYTFPHVHQMISTVKGQKRSDVSSIDVLKSAFPMGSMTGAPKEMATRLIDRHEHFRRDIYSGSIGYLGRDTMDFNVVIRTMLYNADTGAVKIPVGSAITIDSEPRQEYEECWHKIRFWAELLRGA